ncbi:nucleotide exchange factor GrpE [Tannerella sp.]|uniref:nucleotide exchange factor GrpE n=1 Tax=Tannerella sp. TaxID=2382127 RepID=UPI0026DC32CD|nr:nucleotide exchange factor GrpE [Tannerella sp.]MDO4704252.1 nucleotide exchange factor GrpE [Tannerella sp.]
MNKQTHAEKMQSENGSEVTKEQDVTANTSEKDRVTDNVTDANGATPAGEASKENESTDFEVKYNELNDSHLRLRAEFDNYRKRTLREKADLIKMGGETALTGLLPVIDDFERALETVRKTEDVSAAVAEGVELIYNKFMAYLAQQGVKPIEAVGQPFDTELFEAVATIPAPEETLKGKIVDCVQRGYTLYDKVIRHAKVVVGE